MTYGSRRTQPYRKGSGRQPGMAMDAMKRGRGITPNPAGMIRARQRRARRGALARAMR